MRLEGFVGEVEHFELDAETVQEIVALLERIADLAIDDGFAAGIRTAQAAVEVLDFGEEAVTIARAQLGLPTILLVEQVGRPDIFRIARNLDRCAGLVIDAGIGIGNAEAAAEPVERIGEVGEIETQRALDPGDLSAREVDRTVDRTHRQFGIACQNPVIAGIGDLVGEIGERIELDYPVRSEEHTSELQSLMRISYAVFCLKKKKNTNTKQN